MKQPAGKRIIPGIDGVIAKTTQGTLAVYYFTVGAEVSGISNLEQT